MRNNGAAGWTLQSGMQSEVIKENADRSLQKSKRMPSLTAAKSR